MRVTCLAWDTASGRPPGGWSCLCPHSSKEITSWVPFPNRGQLYLLHLMGTKGKEAGRRVHETDPIASLIISDSEKLRALSRLYRGSDQDLNLRLCHSLYPM